MFCLLAGHISLESLYLGSDTSSVLLQSNLFFQSCPCMIWWVKVHDLGNYGPSLRDVAWAALFPTQQSHRSPQSLAFALEPVFRQKFSVLVPRPAILRSSGFKNYYYREEAFRLPVFVKKQFRLQVSLALQLSVVLPYWAWPVIPRPGAWILASSGHFFPKTIDRLGLSYCSVVLAPNFLASIE